MLLKHGMLARAMTTVLQDHANAKSTFIRDRMQLLAIMPVEVWPATDVTEGLRCRRWRVSSSWIPDCRPLHRAWQQMPQHVRWSTVVCTSKNRITLFCTWRPC